MVMELKTSIFEKKLLYITWNLERSNICVIKIGVDITPIKLHIQFRLGKYIQWEGTPGAENTIFNTQKVYWQNGILETFR